VFTRNSESCKIFLAAAQRLADHPRGSAAAAPHQRQPRYDARQPRATIGATPGRGGCSSLLDGGQAAAIPTRPCPAQAPLATRRWTASRDRGAR
jgi:hypothetical protein